MVENNKQLKYHVISAISGVLSRNNGIMRGESYLVFKQSNFSAVFEEVDQHTLTSFLMLYNAETSSTSLIIPCLTSCCISPPTS